MTQLPDTAPTTANPPVTTPAGTVSATTPEPPPVNSATRTTGSATTPSGAATPSNPTTNPVVAIPGNADVLSPTVTNTDTTTAGTQTTPAASTPAVSRYVPVNPALSTHPTSADTPVLPQAAPKTKAAPVAARLATPPAATRQIVTPQIKLAPQLNSVTPVAGATGPRVGRTAETIRPATSTFDPLNMSGTTQASASGTQRALAFLAQYVIPGASNNAAGTLFVLFSIAVLVAIFTPRIPRLHTRGIVAQRGTGCRGFNAVALRPG